MKELKMLKKSVGIGFMALVLSVSGHGMVYAQTALTPLTPMGSASPLSSVGTPGIAGTTVPVTADGLAGALGKIPGIGGLLSGGDKAKESTQLAHMGLHEVQWGLQIAESIKNNENWLINLANVLGTNTQSLLSELNGLSSELTKHKSEMEIIFDDKAGLITTNAQHREFRKWQQDRSVGRLVSLMETSKQIEDETVAERVAMLDSLDASEQSAGLLDVQQSTNELIGVNIATNQKVVTRLNDLVMVENQKEADRIEREWADHSRWCAAMANWPGMDATGACE